MDKEELGRFAGEVRTDLKWMRRWMEDADGKYAKKWIEKTHWLILAGTGAWVLGQILNLIPTVKAIF